jgi:hypothetical protein
MDFASFSCPFPLSAIPFVQFLEQDLASPLAGSAIHVVVGNQAYRMRTHRPSQDTAAG